MIDRWEAQLAKGEVPDYMEAFNQEQLEKLQNLRTRGRTKHGHLVKPPATLKGATDSVVKDALTQGLNDPTKRPYYPLRFKDDPE